MQQHPLSSWEGPSKHQAAHSDNFSPLQSCLTRHAAPGGSALFFHRPHFYSRFCVQFVIALLKTNTALLFPQLSLITLRKKKHCWTQLHYFLKYNIMPDPNSEICYYDSDRVSLWRNNSLMAQLVLSEGCSSITCEGRDEANTGGLWCLDLLVTEHPSVIYV